jgi:purine-binding chemotaxis protein CheW
MVIGAASRTPRQGCSLLRPIQPKMGSSEIYRCMDRIDMSSDETNVLAFELDDQCYGLHLGQVDRVIRAAAATAFPDAPTIVLGLMDIHGTVMPVFNMRRRFGRPERPIEPEDEMIIARDLSRQVVLPTDRVRGVVTCSAAAIVQAMKSLPRSGVIEGVVQLDTGLMLIHDLDRFLTPEEGSELDKALATSAAGGSHE